MSVATSFEDELGAALAAPVAGWSFDWLTGRAVGDEPSWSYRALAAPLVARAGALLDLDTGGGELLASLAAEVGLPATTLATEGWAPNLSPARAALRPLGVRVLSAPDDDVLPVPTAAVDLVLDRHGRLPAAEIARVLRPAGVLLTQQVGSEDCADLNAALGAPPAHRPGSWTAEVAAAAVAAAGMTVDDVREEWPLLRFLDIGAVVYQLRMVPWQIPDFTAARYDRALRRVHGVIAADGHLAVHSHRFLIRARAR